MDEMTIVDTGRLSMAYSDLPPLTEQTGTILLIHGFASTAGVNWINTGWTDALRQAGYRCIAIDNRGHGQSQKFYDATDYGPDIFAADAMSLLDHLGVERCHVMGYSMGARISSWIAAHYPDRVERVVFGGMGEHIFGGRGGYEAIAEALETDEPDSIPVGHARNFRIFADKTGSDRHALAACIRPAKQKVTPDMMASIRAPVLVAVGSDDDVGGRPEPLAAVIPNGEAFVIPGKDHMKATGDAAYKIAVLDFLKR